MMTEIGCGGGSNWVAGVVVVVVAALIVADLSIVLGGVQKQTNKTTKPQKSSYIMVHDG